MLLIIYIIYFKYKLVCIIFIEYCKKKVIGYMEKGLSYIII